MINDNYSEGFFQILKNYEDLWSGTETTGGVLYLFF